MGIRRENWRSLVFFVAALLFGTAACSGSTSTASLRSSPIPVVDCRGAMEAAGAASPTVGARYVSLTLAGELRDYRIFRPPALDSTKPVALIIALHGTPSEADELASISRFDDEAVKAGFLAVYPNGCHGSWHTAAGSDDVNFISRLIDQMQVDFRIDSARVYVVGVSAGSPMAYRMACELSDRIAGVASIAGSMSSSGCQPSRPVSILEMHGTVDLNVPYARGLAAVQQWTTLNGCVGDPVLSQSGITKTLVWNRCNAKAVVRLDTVVGGHHTWFGSDFDPVPGEPNANAEIWTFFSSLQTTA